MACLEKQNCKWEELERHLAVERRKTQEAEKKTRELEGAGTAQERAEVVIAKKLLLLDKKKYFTNSTGMKFPYISPGPFTMGSPSNESGKFSNEQTQHQVTLTKGFYMGVTEVTQGQWKAMMRNNPSYFSSFDDECPVG